LTEDKRYSIDEAHKEFAKQTNGQVWGLLDKPDRTAAEDEQMLLAAYASLYHWTYAGTEVHRQRGEWMLARVYTVLGDADSARQHAQRCIELTEQFPEKMEDFDIAYAYEGLARANALSGAREQAQKYLALAQAAGSKISNQESKDIFTGDINGGDWYGVK
jgi:tetratricopeptide (TPR) repeat protein